MMEPLAENRFTITKELFFEGTLRVTAESYGKLVKKSAAVLAIAWLILTAVTLWQRRSIGYVVIEFVVLCLAALWLYIFMPRSKAKQAFRALVGKYGDDLERVTRFYDGWLEVEGSGRQASFLYSEVKQLLPSKNLLIVVCEDKTGIMLKLDGFTHGSAAAVQELIEKAKMEENEND